MAIHLLVNVIAGFTAARSFSCPISMTVWSIIIALASNVAGMRLYLLIQPPWLINPNFVAIHATVGAIAALVLAPLLAFLFRRLMRPMLHATG
ncbi:MAG: hypothetical protein AAF499_07485 [Pseudomonadota bacterium]